MKIQTIATATLLPATIVGATMPTGATAQAATQPGGQVQVQGGGHPAHDAQRGSLHHWHRVRPGNTLTSIAREHKMTWQAVYATPPNFRHLADPDLLRVGQRLRIPANPKLRAAQFNARFAAALLPRAPAQGQPGGTTAAPSTGSSSYQQCVAQRESGNNPTASSAGLYGILPSTWASLGYSGTAGQASVAQQNEAFSRLYAQYGSQPWSPYDGC